jgi:hypothetical protein
MRPTRPSEAECWRATRRVACQLNHHGLQNATRKRHPVAQYGGPWAGTVVHTTNNMVAAMLTEKHWAKTRKIIRQIADEMTDLQECLKHGVNGPMPREGINHKTLESNHSFYLCLSNATFYGSPSQRDPSDTGNLTGGKTQ